MKNVLFKKGVVVCIMLFLIATFTPMSTGRANEFSESLVITVNQSDENRHFPFLSKH